jgi:hypothetical protein
MKTVFKVGQKVYDQIFFPGKEGTIVDIVNGGDFPLTIRVDFTLLYYRLDGSFGLNTAVTLSTKPYILEMKGFTQEPVEDYSDYIGKWGKFWDEDTFDFVISKLDFYNEENIAKFITSDEQSFNFFEPLTEEQVKILNLK